MLVAFEGIDGSGKTTTASRFAESLRGLGYDAVNVDKRELAVDGGYVERHLSELSELIWKKSYNQPISRLGHAHWVYLNAAYFSAFHESVVVPARARGTVVVVDGWIYKFAARAGVTSGFGVQAVLEQMSSVPEPDMVFLLDVSADVAHSRRLEFNKMEQGGWNGGRLDFIDFQGRVGSELRVCSGKFGWRVESPEERSCDEFADDLAKEFARYAPTSLARSLPYR